MALTPSTMLPLGTAAPAFTLKNVVSSEEVSPAAAAGKPLLVMFICNHCPFVVHVRDVMVDLANKYADQGVAVIAINANSLATHPQDGPEPMKAMATHEGWRFPYCFDETQEVAKAYKAACTPDFYVFDANHKLTYRGQLDDSRPGNGMKVTGADLRAALDATLSGQDVGAEQRPSIGCNIKWIRGNEPDYFG